ncbi:MAG: 4a-hydroxytetrahydrobiopterin dehydratase [Patescibacteria group bacterium]
MNTKLSEEKCVPCEGGVPPIKGAQLERYKKKLDSEAPGWGLRDLKHLQKEYKFLDFKSALAFVNKVGEIAEADGHHPNIEFGWGFARILLWTHAIDGLSENDFYMAAKIERVSLTNDTTS